MQEGIEHRQTSARSSRRHRCISQKRGGEDSTATPWGNRRADYMVCTHLPYPVC